MIKPSEQIRNVGLLLTLVSLISIRLLEPRSRENSYFFRFTGIPLGKVIPVIALIFLLSLIATKRFRSILVAQISEQFDFSEPPIRRIALLRTYLTSIPILAASLYFLFIRTSSFLLQGVDGDYTLTEARNQVLLEQSPLFFSSNLLQGVSGNIYFPINFILDPAGYLLGYFSTINGIYLAHILWSMILFSSIFYVASALKLKPHVTLFVSIFATYLFILPGILQWTVVFFQCPWLYMIVAISNLLIGRILHFRDDKNLYKEFLINLGMIFYFTAYSPLWIMVFLPIILMLLLIKLRSNKDQRTRLLISSLLPWGVVFVLGGGLFTAGLYLASSSFTFSSEFVMPERVLKHASLFFRSVPNASIIALGIVVCFAALKYRSVNKELILLSGTILSFYGFITIFGSYFYVNRDSYVGPAPVYTEFSVLPLVGILAGLFLILFCHSSVLYFTSKFDARIRLGSGWFLLAFTLMIVAYTFTLPVNSRGWAFPAANKVQSNLIDISIYPQNAEFNGRVATFTGLNLPKSISQPELQSYDYNLLENFGDDFRHSNLWFNGIPTFSEYSPTISVWNYAYSKRHFFLNDDKSYRNILVKRRLNLDQLRLIGVSRIITDKKLSFLGEPFVQLDKNGQTIFVYRLQDSNLSGISFKVRKDLESFSGVPSDSKVNLDSKISRFGSGLRIEAKNKGKMYMLLPIEFSNCLDVESDKLVKIFQSQGFLTGIMFNGDLDVKITFRYGVLTNQTCKVRDYLDFKNFKSMRLAISS